MNMIGGLAMDFIALLKSVRRGWIIEPLVHNHLDNLKHSHFLPYLPTPQNVSPANFFAQHQPTGNQCYIKIKLPRKPLRVIQIGLEPVTFMSHRVDVETHATSRPLAYLTYWRANGWVRHQHSHSRFSKHQPDPDDIPKGHNLLVLYRIHRVRKPSRKKRTMILQDVLDLTQPSQAIVAVEIAAKVIEKSFLRKRKPEPFANSPAVVMVDIDKKLYECEEHYI